MQKQPSLLSGTRNNKSPLCTRFGEPLQFYRQRVASLVPRGEHPSAEYKCRTEQLKALQDQLNGKEWLGTWSQQHIALGTYLEVVALVTQFGCLRPALVFKRVGEGFVLQSFDYDLPLSHTTINNLH